MSERNVEITVRSGRTTLMSSLLSWLPMLAVIGLWILIMRRPTGRGAAA